MKIKFILLFFFALYSSAIIIAKDYNASLFGIQSNGTILNTTSIQAAIDYIHEHGGGRLVFYVGRYLTGSIHLRSNVAIQLNEGAILLGSPNPFDYDKENTWMALIFADNQNNIAITGKGMIDGQGYQVVRNTVELIHADIIKDPLSLDRPDEHNRPLNIYFKGCKNINIKDITLKDPASWNQQYDQCKNVSIDNITVDSKSFWNNDGVDIVDCDSVSVTNSYIDAADDGICLKSHNAKFICQNIYIHNNTIRTSANGIKFGSASFGGFRNVRIIQNRIFDTYRSAVILSAIDGGVVENITIDSLRIINTGNVFFFRIGERIPGKKGKMNNVRVSNVYAEISSSKPDIGYSYEGPVEDMPRNISPSSIVGMPDATIQNVSFKNIEIHYPGGGNTMIAKVGIDELDKIPEMAASYPEFSMFKELPAWGIYIRHASEIYFENITLICDKPDYRRAIILDDVHNALFKLMKIDDPDKSKISIFYHRSEVVIE